MDCEFLLIPFLGHFVCLLYIFLYLWYTLGVLWKLTINKFSIA